MNTTTWSSSTDTFDTQFASLKATLNAKRKRFAPMLAILLLHLLAFYFLQAGMWRQTPEKALPKPIEISIVAPPAPTPPSVPAPAVPVAVTLPPPAAYVPPMPELASVQAEPTITVTRAPAAPSSPPAPPVQASAPAAAQPAAQPAPPAASPRLVSDVEYIRAPQPVYPSMARRMGETGVVVLRVLIGIKGQPEQVIVQKSSGSSSLDEAGRQAALRALFKPHMEDGKAVAVFVLVPLNFQLA
jgi:protein TonB